MRHSPAFWRRIWSLMVAHCSTGKSYPAVRSPEAIRLENFKMATRTGYLVHLFAKLV
jgi:hypothetical protein